MSMTGRRTSVAFEVRGIDGGADYSVRLGRLGSANFEFRGSYVLHWIIDNGGLSTPYDCAGLFGDPCGHATALETQGSSDVEHAARDFPVASMATYGRREARRARSEIQSDGHGQSGEHEARTARLSRCRDRLQVRKAVRAPPGSQQPAWTASRRSSSETPRPVADRSTAIPILNCMIRSAAIVFASVSVDFKP